MSKLSEHAFRRDSNLQHERVSSGQNLPERAGIAEKCKSFGICPLASMVLALALTFVATGRAFSEPSVRSDSTSLDPFFTKVADLPLGEKTGRFDYQSFDPMTGRLFIAKMGSAKLLVFDVVKQQLVAERGGFPKVTGVLAVPELHKVYASVPGAGIGASVSVALGIAGLSSGSGGVAILDSASLKELARVPGGVFPDGIAYDPDDQRIFVTDEMGSAVTVIDAETNAVVTRIDMGGEVGNVQYNHSTGKIYAPIQSRNELAVVDPKLNRLVDHYPIPGGRHPHGLRIASDGLTAYVACDNDDRLLVVDLVGRTVLATLPLGHDPDVLADDAGLKRLYVASESGMLSVFDLSTPAKPVKLGDAFVGAHAHSVAVDPGTHRLFLPLSDLNGAAVLRILEPRTH